MRVNSKLELKYKYSFEAPILNAKLKVNNKATEFEQLDTVDLNEILVPFPNETFMVKVNGESMIDENIFDGDLLIVRSTNKASNGDVIISSLNGELTVKTFRIIEGKSYLFSANEKFLPIEIFPMWQFEIQGIVKHVIHQA